MAFTRLPLLEMEDSRNGFSNSKRSPEMTYDMCLCPKIILRPFLRPHLNSGGLQLKMSHFLLRPSSNLLDTCLEKCESYVHILTKKYFLCSKLSIRKEREGTLGREMHLDTPRRAINPGNINPRTRRDWSI